MVKTTDIHETPVLNCTESSSHAICWKLSPCPIVRFNWSTCFATAIGIRNDFFIWRRGGTQSTVRLQGHSRWRGVLHRWQGSTQSLIRWKNYLRLKAKNHYEKTKTPLTWLNKTKNAHWTPLWEFLLGKTCICRPRLFRGVIQDVSKNLRISSNVWEKLMACFQ